jgi:hypothetical protein
MEPNGNLKNDVATIDRAQRARDIMIRFDKLVSGRASSLRALFTNDAESLEIAELFVESMEERLP